MPANFLIGGERDFQQYNPGQTVTGVSGKCGYLLGLHGSWLISFVKGTGLFDNRYRNKERTRFGAARKLTNVPLIDFVINTIRLKTEEYLGSFSDYSWIVFSTIFVVKVSNLFRKPRRIDKRKFGLVVKSKLSNARISDIGATSIRNCRAVLGPAKYSRNRRA